MIKEIIFTLYTRFYMFFLARNNTLTIGCVTSTLLQLESLQDATVPSKSRPLVLRVRFDTFQVCNPCQKVVKSIDKLTIFWLFQSRISRYPVTNTQIFFTLIFYSCCIHTYTVMDLNPKRELSQSI